MGKKLTKWFPIENNPDSPGCYEVCSKFGALPYPYHWYHGDGKWGDDASEKPVDMSESEKMDCVYFYMDNWRGLAVKP